MRDRQTDRPFFLLMLAVVIASCASGPWKRAPDFLSRLRCGMSEAETEGEARRYSKVRITRAATSDPELVVIKGQTYITLGLEAGRIRDYQVSWVSGFMERTYELKRDLCSNELLVELHILGPSSAAGSTVLLDGEEVGKLSAIGTLTIDVPLGKHYLRVEKTRVGSWSTELSYDESSSGYDRLPIPEQALRPNA